MKTMDSQEMKDEKSGKKEISMIEIKPVENGFVYRIMADGMGGCEEYIYDDVEEVMAAVKDDLTSPHMRGGKPPLGSGERFKQLEGKLEAKGAKSPAALAAWIGRKKYGEKKFQKLSSKGKRLFE